MKIIAIISEYNPFHLGHLHQINEIKKIFKNENIIIISIMSGNFIQRGEPSIIDKFKRCETALNNGINLCFEIPVQVSLSSAEGFAYGAIKILHELKLIDFICFGCEIPDENKLNIIADTLISVNKNDLKKYLDLGFSFPKSQELMISEKFNDINLTNFIKSSNNILGIEYLKSIKILNSPIKIIPIQRIGGNYNDTFLHNQFSSASAIRNVLLDSKNYISILKNHIPKETYKILNEEYSNKNFINKEFMFKYIKYKLMTNKNIHKIEDMNEGLENKFYSEILKSNSLNDLILNVKSKRYTYSRISRILSKYFIGFENFDRDYIKTLDNYVRILGFDKKGLELLNKLKKKSKLNLISKFNKKNSTLAPLDILATKSYSILNKSISPLQDFEKPPIIKL